MVPKICYIFGENIYAQRCEVSKHYARTDENPQTCAVLLEINVALGVAIQIRQSYLLRNGILIQNMNFCRKNDYQRFEQRKL